LLKMGTKRDRRSLGGDLKLKMVRLLIKEGRSVMDEAHSIGRLTQIRYKTISNAVLRIGIFT